jgi:hypothetical protein
MSYCKEFFHKYEKDGNFCGLDKSQESRINGYLSIVKLLEKQDIPEDQIYKNFTVKAAEPLIQAKDEARTKGLNYVTHRLMDGEKITSGDLQSSFKTWGFTKAKKSCISATPPTEPEPESCTNATTIPSVPVEAPPSPVAQTLKERYTITEIPPPLSKDADMDEVLKRDALLLAMAQSDKPPMFTTAAQLINGGLVTKPAPYKMAPMTKEDAEQRLIEVVRGFCTAKDREALGDIMRTGEFGSSYVEIFTGMIWHCREQMVGS